jgi:hypothetical protein
MVTVAEYKTFITQKVIPAELLLLDKCESALAVSDWRINFCKSLRSKMVMGEQACDVDYNP